ncbi:MAG: SusD/RagB family nutrient-binding outer membrane lipoprotein [Bacteroidetes bacterium]|nr:MAG: SusD/RagB family nutrient-binding outer membrane lipoprotein [Bacteroidota bacterium]
MKKILIRTSIMILGVSVLAGCKKYLDINQNPNAAEEPPINGLLANTTYKTADNIFNASNITSYYVQYLAGPNPSEAKDIYDQIDASGTWGGFYDIMTDLYDMKRFGADKGQNAYIGVSDILMSLHLSTLTNLWGDVPYSEAFLGVNKLTPKFDNQQDLYDSCLNLLNAGIAALSMPDAEGELDASSDFIHGGDASAWIKTAHALKARLLNQISKTGAYNPDAVLAELAEAYGSNSDDAQVTAYVEDVNSNPWGSVAIANAGLNLDGWLSSHFIDATNSTTFGVFDPRLPLITQVTQFGDYRGTPNGKGRIGTGTEHEECYLDVDKWYSTQTAPLQLITYAEGKFVESEAKWRKGDLPGAYTAYIDGIKAHMAKMGVADTAVTRYTTEPTVAVGSANLTLQLILKEKYIACFLSPVTWDDARRTDYNYKDFNLPVNALLSSFIRRINYPSNELSRNGANAPNVALSDHLWWDN